MIELSLTELYEGEAPAFEILVPVLADGLEPIDIGIAYSDPRSYRLPQIDALVFPSAICMAVRPILWAARHRVPAPA